VGHPSQQHSRQALPAQQPHTESAMQLSSSGAQLGRQAALVGDRMAANMQEAADRPTSTDWQAEPQSGVEGQQTGLPQPTGSQTILEGLALQSLTETQGVVRGISKREKHRPKAASSSPKMFAQVAACQKRSGRHLRGAPPDTVPPRHVAAPPRRHTAQRPVKNINPKQQAAAQKCSPRSQHARNVRVPP
jgi:hypothetical protein